jgi:hypothetical protein
MLILQLIQNTLSDPSIYGYIGAGSGIGATAGAIGMKLIDKWLNKKKEDVDITDVINQQVKQVMDNGDFQAKIIKQLQEHACFREPCKERINGTEPTKTTKKKAA